MNSHETMMEQIRRLNAEEALKHEQRKEEVLNKIRLLRRAQREQQERQPTSDSVGCDSGMG
jgi:hypothetical protein